MASMDKVLITAFLFAFSVFLFPLMYDAILSYSTTNSAYNLLVAIPILIVTVTGGAFVYSVAERK